MKYLAYILIMILVPLHAQVRPDAVGYGSNWTFPVNYEVRIVDNLTDSGAGSLRVALDGPTATDAVIVVFNGLSGRIHLEDVINIDGSKKIYIEGATSDNGIWISMADDTEDAIFSSSGIMDGFIARNLTFAVGPGQFTEETTPHQGEGNPGSRDGSGNVNGDNITVSAGRNMLFDKCVFLWSTDESLNFFNTNGLTVQNCIIGESLMYATHAYTTDANSGVAFSPHSMGMLIDYDSSDITLYNNLWIHNNQRSPLVKSTGSGSLNMEMVNNYNYNWGDYAASWNEDFKLVNVNITNGVYDNGPDSSVPRRPVWIQPKETENMAIYAANLYSDLFGTDFDLMTDRGPLPGGGSPGGNFDIDLRAGIIAATPHEFPLAGHPALTREQIKTSVMAGAGTVFDSATEQRLKAHVNTGTGTLIDDPSEVGGYPAITAGTIIADADQDGIPDGNEAEWGDDTWGYLLSLEGAVSAPPVAGNGSGDGALFGTVN